MAACSPAWAVPFHGWVGARKGASTAPVGWPQIFNGRYEGELPSENYRTPSRRSVLSREALADQRYSDPYRT
jgi:hypothetical protein